MAAEAHASTSKSILQERRQLRKQNDPHHAHPFKRIYLGPSPIAARQASAVAMAIAHDAQIDRPTTINVIGAQGTIASTSGAAKQLSADSAIVPSHDGALGALMAADTSSVHTTSAGEAISNVGRSLFRRESRQSLQSQRSASASPVKRVRDLPPLSVPRTSAGYPIRRPSGNAGAEGLGRRTSLISFDDDVRPSALRSRSARRQMSQSMFEQGASLSASPHRQQHANMDIEASRRAHSKQRRQHSESSALDGPHRLSRYPSNTLLEDGLPHKAAFTRPDLPLLDISVDEEGPHQFTLSPEQATFPTDDDRFLRHVPSHLSESARSTTSGQPSIVQHKLSSSSMQATQQQVAPPQSQTHDVSNGEQRHTDVRSIWRSPSTADTGAQRAKQSDPPTTAQTEQTGNVLTDTDTMQRRQISRVEEMRQKARERYKKSRMAQNVAFSTLRSPKGEMDKANGGIPRRHIRDASRQSRLSYVSAAGTQTSIGTRLTEGSFGATGGFRAKLVRKLGMGEKEKGKARLPSTQSVRASHSRMHSRHSSLSRGGVVPGAVGTSSGGTKWIGQTFEVGKRLFEVLENCEEALCGVNTLSGDDAALEAVREEDDGNLAARGRGRRNAKRKEDGASQIESPDDVLIKYAKQASEGRDDVLNIGAKTKTETILRTNRRSTTTPALVLSGSDSEPSDEQPVTPVRPNGERRGPGEMNGNGYAKSDTAALAIPGESQQKKLELQRVSSNASLLTVPQDREALSGWDIENRKGWSDVVSFITAQSNLPSSIQRSARSAGDNINEMGTRAKRAFDGQVADFRARQLAAKQAREQNRPIGPNDLRRTAIEEGEGGVESSKAPSLVDEPGKFISQEDMLKQPEAPLIEENGKIAEATFELTRRPSFPGIAPDGETVNDAASDHEVAARPTFEAKDASANLTAETTTQPPSSLRSMVQMEKEASGNGSKKVVQFEHSLHGRMPQRSLTVDGKEMLQGQTRSSPLTSSGEEKLQLLAGRLRPAARSGDSAPAPPEEVLSRNTTPDEKLDKAGRLIFESEETITLRSALRRDRMLVKVAWTPSEDVPKEFTERESRKYEMHADPFREYMVVFRTGRLELWDDPSWAARMVGHADDLKLRYVAPLRRGRAFVSLYSAIDQTFCLTFIPDHSRSLFNLRRSGTHIWLFDARSVSNGADWIWELWRELGGQIPDAIDVHIPVMGTRVRIPIPSEMEILEHRSKKIKKKGWPRLPGADQDSKEDVDSHREESGEGYKVISIDNVLDTVSELLSAMPHWSDLRSSVMKSGLQFGLAWRSHLQLNWIQHSTSTDGSPRDWTVLVGALLCDSKAPSTLEYRGATHYPHRVRLAQGKELLEPPAIEGFVWRVKTASNSLTRLYVTTQDGLLFINRPSRAFPPERVIASDWHLETHQLRRESNGSVTNLSIDKKAPRRGRKGSKSSLSAAGAAGSSAPVEETLASMGRRVMELITLVPKTLEEIDAQMEAFRAFEKRRQFEQVVHADGYIDVRDIYMIRSVDEKGPTRRPSCDETTEQDFQKGKSSSRKSSAEHKRELGADADEDEGSDDDAGGEEGYELSKDRAALKRARQIEVVLVNGRSIRLECYSKSVAHEWIHRVADISQYWKRREKVDALEIMNASGFDPTLIQRKLQMRREPRPLDRSADSERLAPVLGSVWNWCILSACRTIIRSGQLFMKRKPYTAFGSRYCILVSGRLLTYKLMTSTRTARARQNAGIFHKRQETVIHLRDSYVYSGKLTDHMLVNGRSDGAGALSSTYGGGSGGAATSSTRHTLPRVYADGLLSVDEDEECTFVIRYRPQRVNQTADPHVNVVDQDVLSEHRHHLRDHRPHLSHQAHHDVSLSSGKNKASITTLRDSTVNVIALRARSKLERDLWVWAINSERERIVRDDRARELQIRHHGKTPFRNHHH